MVFQKPDAVIKYIIKGQNSYTVTVNTLPDTASVNNPYVLRLSIRTAFGGIASHVKTAGTYIQLLAIIIFLTGSH